MREDRYIKAVRIAMRALEMYESVAGELPPEEKLLLRSRLVEQALSLLEKRESSES
jgi:hypothetical protein